MPGHALTLQALLVSALVAGCGESRPEQAATATADSSPAAVLAHTIAEKIGAGFEEVKGDGWSIVEPVSCEFVSPETTEAPRVVHISFTYMFPLPIDGATRENLVRPTGELVFRKGHWHIVRINVAHKLFTASEFSAEGDLMTIDLEGRENLGRLKTLWQTAVRETIAEQEAEVEAAAEAKAEAAAKAKAEAEGESPTEDEAARPPPDSTPP